MYNITPQDDLETIAWKTTPPEDLWVMDKLIFSRIMGYNCGPVGMDVPRPDYYVVRPCVNALGMGAGAQEMYLEGSTDHLEPGHFWCDWFYGQNYSVDYHWGEQVLAVKGYLRSSKELHRWDAWYLEEERRFPLPPQLKELSKKYEYLNVEFIEDLPIEVHLRQNPDWLLAENIIELRPVWHDEKIGIDKSKYTFIVSPDGNRKGFYAKFR